MAVAVAEPVRRDRDRVPWRPWPGIRESGPPRTASPTRRRPVSRTATPVTGTPVAASGTFPGSSSDHPATCPRRRLGDHSRVPGVPARQRPDRPERAVLLPHHEVHGAPPRNRTPAAGIRASLARWATSAALSRPRTGARRGAKESRADSSRPPLTVTGRPARRHVGLRNDSSVTAAPPQPPRVPPPRHLRATAAPCPRSGSGTGGGPLGTGGGTPGRGSWARAARSTTAVRGPRCGRP